MAASPVAEVLSDTNVGYMRAPASEGSSESDVNVSATVPVSTGEAVSDVNILSTAQLLNPAPMGIARLPMRSDFTEEPYAIVDELGNLLVDELGNVLIYT